MRQGMATWTSCSCLLLAVFSTLVPEQTNAATPPVLAKNGTIVWGSFDVIPPSTLYQDFNDVEKPQGILDMAEGFANFVVNDLPYEAIRMAVDDVQDGSIDDDEIAETVWSVSKGFWGVIVLVTIGILLFLFAPIVGLCFCCCRCCNNCGGKRSQLDSNRGCKRVTLSILFVAVIGIVCAGMAFTNSANDFQGRVVTESDQAFNSLTDAVLNYSKDITKQIDYMVNVQYSFVDNVIRTTLLENQLGTDVTDYVKEDLGMQTVINDLSKISSDLRSVEEAYGDLNDGRSELIAKENQLAAELNDVNADLQNANASCADCLGPFDANVHSTFTLIPEVTLDQMTRVNAGALGVEDLNKQINDSLHQIESEVNLATNDSVYEVIDVMDSTQETVEDSFQELENYIVDASESLKSLQEDYTNILEEYDEYLEYRWYFFLAVTCSILLVLVVMIIGFTMGTICYTRGDPRDRSGASNCGGNFLMLNVFFMCVLFPILILLTCVLFAVFGLGTAFCTPLRTLELYEQTIDYPRENQTYYLGELLYGNATYNVTVSGMLKACKADHTLYNATKLYYVFNFEELNEEYKNLEESLRDFIGDVEDISLDFSVIPSDLETELNGLVTEVGLADFDANAYNEQLDQSILASDDYLLDYANHLDVLSAQHPNLTIIAEELRRIQTNLVDPMEDTVASMKADVATVVSVNESLPLDVNRTLEDSDTVEKAVNNVNETAVAINITEEYVTYLTDIGYSFIMQNEHQIINDFAKCRNVWDIYDVSLLFSCGYVLNSFNALWFTIGWCVFFFLPAIFLSVKLAKHYRIMQEVRQPKPKKRKDNGRPAPDPEAVGLSDMNGGYPGNGHSDQMLYPPQNGYPGGGMTPVDNPRFEPDEPHAYDSRGNPIRPPPPYNYAAQQSAPSGRNRYDPNDRFSRNSQDLDYGPGPSQPFPSAPPSQEQPPYLSSAYVYEPYYCNFLGSPQAVGHESRSSPSPGHSMPHEMMDNLYNETLC